MDPVGEFHQENVSQLPILTKFSLYKLVTCQIYFNKKINHRQSLPKYNKTSYLKKNLSIFICFSVYPLHTPVLIWVHSDDYLGVGGHWGCITLLHWWLGSNGQELEQPVGWSMNSDHKTCFNSE